MENELTNIISQINFELETSDSTPFLPTSISTEQDISNGDILIKQKGNEIGFLAGLRVPIYIWAAAILATTGGILFGYDLGIISGAILQLRQEFCLGIVKSEVMILNYLFYY